MKIKGFLLDLHQTKALSCRIFRHSWKLSLAKIKTSRTNSQRSVNTASGGSGSDGANVTLFLSYTNASKTSKYTFGPKNSNRRVKQIVITKQANNPNVELNLTLSQLVFFKKQLPKVVQERHDLASYLEDLNAKKVTGPRLVDFLNNYVKQGTVTTLGSTQPQWVISNCFQKTIK
ncbi:MAG: hypothetical protein B7Y39_19440 [Bdellovibrio sp. 28-41-41]|nr:MAG: hypothetical protein B7Y39_19440 [Bdellovibrio sp. 28-41-41]